MARVLRCLALLLSLTAVSFVAWAQEYPALAPGVADDHSDWVERGVLKVVPSQALEGETLTPSYEAYELRNIPGIDYTPYFESKEDTVFERAKEVTLRRSIWALEFAFKPVRMIEVDVPQPEGRMRRKTVWYMLYRVRNLGGHLEPATGARFAQSEEIRTRAAANELNDDDRALAEKELKARRIFRSPALAEKARGDDSDRADSFDRDFPESADEAASNLPQMRFVPTIVLKAHDIPKREGEEVVYIEKEYLDRVIPSALPLIAKRERVGKPIYDSVTITRQKIEVTTADEDNSVWGVAMWENVDPRVDYFSVFVQGLTNAYRFTDNPAGVTPADRPAKGRIFERKTLLVHFWRPGDTVEEDEKEIRYGMPIASETTLQEDLNARYGYEDRLDYRWIYR